MQKSKSFKRRPKGNRRRKIQQDRLTRARKQINELFLLISLTDNLSLKRSYIKHIRSIAQKVQMSLPKHIKYSFCRRCTEIFTLSPEKTFSLRLRQNPIPHQVFTCHSCGHIKRIPYKTKRNSKEVKK